MKKKILLILVTLSIIFTFVSCIGSNDLSLKKDFNDEDDEIITQATTTQTEATTTVTKATTTTKPIYTVKFKANGGTAVAEMRAEKLYAAPLTTQKGYLFEGWYLDNSFTQKVVYPMPINQNMTVYAKWLKLESTITCPNAKIKDTNKYSNYAFYYVTPNGFDMARLEQLGYYMTITVNYEVRYVKDYDVLFDIGYAGAPKYEVYLLDSDNRGTGEEDLKTYTDTTKRSITYRASIADLKNDKITLEFSTNNIQNIIYFENIVVTYTCTK